MFLTIPRNVFLFKHLSTMSFLIIFLATSHVIVKYKQNISHLIFWILLHSQTRAPHLAQLQYFPIIQKPNCKIKNIYCKVANNEDKYLFKSFFNLELKTQLQGPKIQNLWKMKSSAGIQGTSMQNFSQIRSFLKLQAASKYLGHRQTHKHSQILAQLKLRIFIYLYFMIFAMILRYVCISNLSSMSSLHWSVQWNKHCWFSFGNYFQ